MNSLKAFLTILQCRLIDNDKSQIHAVNWEEYKTDTAVEFGKSPKNGYISIQDALRRILETQDGYIIYDHGPGEIADYITVKEDENRITVHLYHVKKQGSANFNSNMSDVYEVSGQAVKSIIWLTSKQRIKSINKQIQEAESAFRLASAGVENFETTTAGLSSKLSTLQRTFQLQQDAVGQYERALQQASNKLQECYTRQNDYAQRLVNAKDK